MLMEKGTQEYTCPMCGSSERWIVYVAEQEKNKGTMRRDVPAGSKVEQHLVAQPDKAPVAGFSAPLILCYYDHCVKCGQEYCFRITWDVATFRHKSGLVVPKLNMPPSAS